MLAFLFGATLTASAANAGVTFNPNNELVYSNVTANPDGSVNMGDIFKGIAPGEDRQQSITLTNTNSRTVDFYMDVRAIQALEESQKSATGAGYDITLTAGTTVLYDSSVGGYGSASAAGSTSGLKEINDGELSGFALVATLAQGESEQITLRVFFDGEAMDNNSQGIDYSMTIGQFGFLFKVAYDDPAGPRVFDRIITNPGPATIIRTIRDIVSSPETVAGVLTGDAARIGLAVIVLGIGLTLFLVTNKKKAKGRES
jgi:hypothetical protein